MIKPLQLTLLASALSAAVLGSSCRSQKGDVVPAADPLVEAVVHTRLGRRGPPNWDLYLFEEPGTEPRRLTNDPALDYNAVFSTDGRWVVFTSERTGSADLYALDLEAGGEPMRLTRHPAMDDAVSFSPDGERLAFVSTREGDADIFVMPFSPGDATAESRAVNLTRRPGGDFNPAFSPDGRQIAFSRQPSLRDGKGKLSTDIELCVMNADGSDVQTVATKRVGIPEDVDSGGEGAGSPAWSTDGEAIYYYYAFEFYRVSAGGDEEQGYASEIRRVSRDGSGDVRVVTDGYSPAVAPDGRVAFVRPLGENAGPPFGPGRIFSVASDDSDPRAESTALEDCFAPDFDRSSGRMVCHGPGPVEGMVLVDGKPFAPPGGIRRVELPDRILEVRGIRGYFPALTPDGEVISSLRVASFGDAPTGRHAGMTVPLQLSAVDGTGLRELFMPSSGIAWDAAVARDAGWAVFAVGPTFGAVDMDVDIWRIRLDGSEAVNLTPDSPWNDALPGVSDDGRRIVFRSSRHAARGKPDDDSSRSMDVYVMDSDGESVRRLTDGAVTETAPAISTDGEWVAYVVHENNVARIWLRRVDGSQARLLEPDRAAIPGVSMHPSFSPDDKWVVFTSDRGGFNDEWPLTFHPSPYGDLWAVPVAGGPAVRLTDDKWGDGPPVWGYVRLPGGRR